MRLLAQAVVTVDDDQRVHRPGALDIAAGSIEWVGPQSGAPPSPGEVLDVGGLLMPGLVNTHAHSPMVLFRSLGDGLPLERWLREVVWPREGRLTEDDVYWGMLAGCHELLRCGVTTTCEMYLHNHAIAAGALDAGIRCVVTPAIFDIAQAGPGGTWRHFLDDAVSLYAGFDGREARITVGLGPHSVYAIPTEALDAVARVATELGALVQVHVAETAAEQAQVAERHGCSAPVLLDRHGVLEGRVLAAHSIWLSDDDLDLYVRRGVAVAHCPQSNGKLGSGVARVPEMLARGLRVGLGTDGPASNDNLDLWEELRLAPVLARATACDPAALPTPAALHLATRGGADVLGLATGSLEPGRAADLIRLDVSDGAFLPVGDDRELLSHIVWAAARRVTDVWVGGRRVVRGGRPLTIDAAETHRQVSARAARLGDKDGGVPRGGPSGRPPRPG